MKRFELNIARRPGFEPNAPRHFAKVVLYAWDDDPALAAQEAAKFVAALGAENYHYSLTCWVEYGQKLEPELRGACDAAGIVGEVVKNDRY